MSSTYVYNGFDVLVGHRIDGIILNDDATAIEFRSGDERFYFQADADCCSDSWFNHFSGVQSLIGHTVASVIEREMQETDGTRQEVDKLYGWTFVTELGYSDLELRNSSNGYYGGRAYLITTDEPLNGRIVTEDF